MLILQHFKHCPLQISPLYLRYIVPNVSSIIGMLPGTPFLWWLSVPLSHFPESLLWFGNDFLSKWFWVWETGKSLLRLSPENRVDGAQRISDVLQDNCAWGAMREPVHCRRATYRSGFPTIQASSCHSSLKGAKTSWYNCLFATWPRGTNSWWTMPFQSENTTNISLIFYRLIRAFFGRGDRFPIHRDNCILVSTSCP